MVNKYQVSVIIPNYNYSTFIGECIQSVIQSEFDHDKMEIIVIDDASTDDSLKKIREKQQHSSIAIQLIQNDTNLGVIRSRNRAIKNSTSEYLFFLDADNKIEPECISKHYNILHSNADYSACYSPIQDFNNETHELLALRSNEPFDYDRLLKGPYIDAMAMFRRKDLIELGMYDLNSNQWGDYELWLKMGKNKKKVYFIEGKPLSNYRIHGRSMINQTTENDYNLIILYLKQKYDIKLELYNTDELFEWISNSSGILNRLQQKYESEYVREQIINKKLFMVRQEYERKIHRMISQIESLQNTVNEFQNQSYLRLDELGKLKNKLSYKLACTLSLYLSKYLKYHSAVGVFHKFKTKKEAILIKQSGLFDENYYLLNNPDVKSNGIKPLEHFLIYGGMEGRNPSGSFDSAFYLSQFPNVKASGINPLVHYIFYAKKEKRDPIIPQKNQNTADFFEMDDQKMIKGNIRSLESLGLDYLSELRRIITTYSLEKNRKCLEWGMGYSTRFFLENRETLFLNELYSLDHNEDYFHANIKKLPHWSHFHPILIDLIGLRNSDRDPEFNYSTIPQIFLKKFDIIYIDGRRRMECVFQSINLCHPGTIVIMHDYRRKRYENVNILYDILEDGLQFRVMKLKPKVFDLLQETDNRPHL